MRTLAFLLAIATTAMAQGEAPFTLEMGLVAGGLKDVDRIPYYNGGLGVQLGVAAKVWRSGGQAVVLAGEVQTWFSWGVDDVCYLVPSALRAAGWSECRTALPNVQRLSLDWILPLGSHGFALLAGGGWYWLGPFDSPGGRIRFQRTPTPGHGGLWVFVERARMRRIGLGTASWVSLGFGFAIR